MPKQYSNKVGQARSSRSPSGIENAEHYDMVGAKKELSVVAGTYSISPNSNTETAVEPRQIVRFYNNSGAVAFVWVGEAGTAPGTVDATNGLAVASQTAITIATGELINEKSVAFKTSSASVQAALLE